VFAAAIAWPLLGQVLTGWQIGGGVVVLTGIALAQTARIPTPPPPLLPEPSPREADDLRVATRRR
jgi:hypothetical protein